MIRLLIILILVGCGNYTKDNRQRLAYGTTTCTTLNYNNTTYCVNVYNDVRTCYRDDLAYIISCDEYDRIIDWL